MGEEEEEENEEDETKTTNLEAPAALHITGKSGVCVSLQGSRSWILKGEVLFKLPAPLEVVHGQTEGGVWVKSNGRRGIEVVEANERDKKSVPPFSYHHLLHISLCAALWGKGESEEGGAGGWKEKHALWSPSQREDRGREGKLQKANWN